MLSNCEKYVSKFPIVVLGIPRAPEGPLTDIVLPASRYWTRPGTLGVEPPAEKVVTVQAPNVAMSNPADPGVFRILKNVAPPASVRVVAPGTVIGPTVIGGVTVTV